MSEPKNSLPSMETSAARGFKNASGSPEKGTLVKKKNTAAGDPTKMAKPARTKVTATSGARYGVRVKFQKTTAPEAGAIQGNGRILPSAVKRQSPNFNAGIADHN
jgi:hypothetical protein